MTCSEGEPQDPATKFIIKLPNGELTDLARLRQHEEWDTRYALLTLLIEAGDLIAFRDEDDAEGIGGFSFEVTEVGKDQRGEAITGRLSGYGLEAGMQASDLLLIGSGWGGSMMSPGILTTGRGPYFSNPMTGEEYRLPSVQAIDVFRRGQEGTYYLTEGIVKQLT
jgi:hypothetical protein